MANIVVVGAGIVGVSTAYLLSKAGHQVTLLDSHDAPCTGTSARNGAQLSYAYSDALASPSLLAHLPDIALGRDPAYRLRLQADPEFLIWGLRFLLNARPGRFLANTRHLLDMAAATERLLADLLAEHDLHFDYAVAGKMILYPTEQSLAAARPGLELKTGLGIAQSILSRTAASDIEPALHRYRDPIAGVIYSPHDAVGQPHLFCEQVIALLVAQHGMAVRYGQKARAVVARSGRACGVLLERGETLNADAVIVCTGQANGLGTSSTYGSIWPVQGYSITTPALPGAMRVSITDVTRKTVFARLGDSIRIAGIADIGRRNIRFERDRFAVLRQSAGAAFADCFELGDDSRLEPWTGGRPMTPSSRPIIARGRQAGVYLNLGHGALGWTLSLGSAERLCALIAEDMAGR